MKGIILAGGSVACLIGFSAIGLRLYRGDKEYKVFLGSLGAALAIYALVFAALPPDLGVLPTTLREPAARVDFLNGLIVIVAMFHGFWVFAYVACLGPTMSILVELSRRGDRGMTMDEALRLFGSDEPVNVVLRRRLPKLVNGRYLAEQDGVYTLLPRGVAAGKICLYARRAIGDGSG